jgi:predicted dehydrogenase
MPTAPVMAGQPARPLRVGVLGAGMITTVFYGFLPGLARIPDRAVATAITSRTRARAEAVAAAYGIGTVYDNLADMIAHGSLDAIVNATPAAEHFETSRQILAAGKHLVTDKPLAGIVQQAQELMRIADDSGAIIVCAPFDMLAGEWREARRLVVAGAVGKVTFARVHSSNAGPAAMSWPTDPTWYYQEGAGSLADIGVYGITRVTGVLGPALRVCALSGTSGPVRHARGGVFDGLPIAVTADGNTLLMLDFGDAIFAVIDGTFGVVASRAPQMEIYGLSGTLLVSDPQSPPPPGEVPIEAFRLDAAPGLPGWISPRTVGLPPGPDRTKKLARAVLIEHLADCLRDGTLPVPSGEHATHVLEIILAAQQAARTGTTIDLDTTFSPR